MKTITKTESAYCISDENGQKTIIPFITVQESDVENDLEAVIGNEQITDEQAEKLILSARAVYWRIYKQKARELRARIPGEVKMGEVSTTKIVGNSTDGYKVVPTGRTISCPMYTEEQKSWLYDQLGQLMRTYWPSSARKEVRLA